MNKSLATNLISAAFILLGYLSPVYPDHILAVGLFATSGALTNWIAVHMLFEKVPGLYGSGIIPNRFEEFKSAIRNLIMNQFFTRENVDTFFSSQVGDHGPPLDPEPIVEAIDYDQVFSSFIDAVIASPFGGMLGLIGGPSALTPLREPFKKRMRKEVHDILFSPAFIAAVKTGLKQGHLSEDIIQNVDQIVTRRLDELTPEMVKKIIQDMIREHLGWLVIWGGVFGGAIGLATSFVR